MTTTNNVNYKDTFLWLLCVQEQPEVAKLLAKESKSVTPLSDGIEFLLLNNLKVRVRFEIKQGLFTEMQLDGNTSLADLKRIRSCLETQLDAKSKQEADAQKVSKVNDLFRQVGFVDGNIYLGQSGLILKVFVSLDKTCIEIGYNDDYCGFESLHSVNFESSEIQSVLYVKNLCARLIREYVGDLNQDLNHLLNKE